MRPRSSLAFCRWGALSVMAGDASGRAPCTAGGGRLEVHATRFSTMTGPFFTGVVGFTAAVKPCASQADSQGGARSLKITASERSAQNFSGGSSKLSAVLPVGARRGRGLVVSPGGVWHVAGQDGAGLSSGDLSLSVFRAGPTRSHWSPSFAAALSPADRGTRAADACHCVRRPCCRGSG